MTTPSHVVGRSSISSAALVAKSSWTSVGRRSSLPPPVVMGCTGHPIQGARCACHRKVAAGLVLHSSWAPSRTQTPSRSHFSISNFLWLVTNTCPRSPMWCQIFWRRETQVTRPQSPKVWPVQLHQIAKRHADQHAFHH